MENEIVKLDSFVFTDDYIKDIKNILSQTKNQSYKTVNSIMIQANWLIGCRIVEQEQNGKDRAAYGEKVIENLSKELNKELGSGMSVAHLKNCRQFYLTFPLKEISYTLCSQLSWSHIRLIMRLDTKADVCFLWNIRKMCRALLSLDGKEYIQSSQSCFSTDSRFWNLFPVSLMCDLKAVLLLLISSLDFLHLQAEDNKYKPDHLHFYQALINCNSMFFGCCVVPLKRKR